MQIFVLLVFSILFTAMIYQVQSAEGFWFQSACQKLSNGEIDTSWSEKESKYDSDFGLNTYEDDPEERKFRVLGDCAVEDKDEHMAISYYEAALNINPYSPEVLNHKGYVLSKLESYGDALEVCEFIQKHDLHRSGDNCSINIHLDKGDCDTVRSEIQYRAENEWANPLDMMYFGEYWLCVKNYEYAMDWYNTAIEEIHELKKDPASFNFEHVLPFIHTGKGHAHMEIGHPDEALNEYTNALNFSPDRYEPLLGKGNAYLALNKTNEAMTYFKRALDVNPTSEEAQNRLDLTMTQQIQEDVETISKDVEEIDIQVEVLKWITIIGTIASAISLGWAIKRRRQHKQLQKSIDRVETKVDDLPDKINKSSPI